MPMPQPQKDETQDAFISRFMGDSVMVKDYPEEKQRAAVAYSTWRRMHANEGVMLKTNMSRLVGEGTLDGKRFLKVPVVLITEGVHNNGLYPAEELAKFPQTWNNRPVCIYHPKNDKGHFCSCNNKEQLEKVTVGLLLNTTWNPETKKLLAEAWIDPEKCQKVDPRVLSKLQQDEMLEVSTGLFSDDDEKVGNWNSEMYSYVVKNIRPDHLAILPDIEGACSIADGAGMPRINQQQEQKMDAIELMKSLMEKLGFTCLAKKETPPNASDKMEDDEEDESKDSPDCNSSKDMNAAAPAKDGYSSDKAQEPKTNTQEKTMEQKQPEKEPTVNQITMTKDELDKYVSDQVSAALKANAKATMIAQIKVNALNKVPETGLQAMSLEDLAKYNDELSKVPETDRTASAGGVKANQQEVVPPMPSLFQTK